MRTACVYSRPGCHLCEQLIEELLPLLRGRCRIDVRDVDTDDEWCRRFGNRVPVLEIDGRFVCQHRLDPQAVSRVLQQGG